MDNRITCRKKPYKNYLFSWNVTALFAVSQNDIIHKIHNGSNKNIVKFYNNVNKNPLHNKELIIFTATPNTI